MLAEDRNKGLKYGEEGWGGGGEKHRAETWGLNAVRERVEKEGCDFLLSFILCRVQDAGLNDEFPTFV